MKGLGEPRLVPRDRVPRSGVVVRESTSEKRTKSAEIGIERWQDNERTLNLHPSPVQPLGSLTESVSAEWQLSQRSGHGLSGRTERVSEKGPRRSCHSDS